MNQQEHAQIKAIKSLLSSYALRAKQAEETASLLMTEKLTPEQMQKLMTLTFKHMDELATERAVQLTSVLQALGVSLHAALQLDDSKLRPAIQDATRTLAIAMGHMQIEVPFPVEKSNLEPHSK